MSWRTPGPSAGRCGLGRASVPLTIGSDDPITFATTLPHEYQLLADALVRAGRGEGEARELVERVRENGLDWRFTKPGLPEREPTDVVHVGRRDPPYPP